MNQDSFYRFLDLDLYQEIPHLDLDYRCSLRDVYRKRNALEILISSNPSLLAFENSNVG